MMQRLLAKVDANQAEMLARMEVKTDSTLKEIVAEIRACRKETTACQEATEACLESKEPTPVETESVAVQEEVPQKETTGKTTRGLKE
jgi:cell pole-organizing protein PopZ